DDERAGGRSAHPRPGDRMLRGDHPRPQPAPGVQADLRRHRGRRHGNRGCLRDSRPRPRSSGSRLPEHRPEPGPDGFAVNEVMGVRFSGLLASLFWRATYLFKLESPQNRAQVAADWLLGVFFRPAV
ncbi:MAG: NADH dehydrogenase, partial [uncultured Rubrobacteraceae bacterium]